MFFFFFYVAFLLFQYFLFFSVLFQSQMLKICVWIYLMHVYLDVDSKISYKFDTIVPIVTSQLISVHLSIICKLQAIGSHLWFFCFLLERKWFKWMLPFLFSFCVDFVVFVVDKYNSMVVKYSASNSDLKFQILFTLFTYTQ